MIFSKVKNILLIATTVVALSSVGAVYWIHNSSQKQIKALITENSQLSIAAEINQQTIEQMQNDLARTQETTNRLQQEYAEIQRQNFELLDRFEGHNIGRLAEKKPGLIENIVNNATANALRCFEVMSGSPRTEPELSAPSPEKANPECPWLFE